MVRGGAVMRQCGSGNTAMKNLEDLRSAVGANIPRVANDFRLSCITES